MEWTRYRISVIWNQSDFMIDMTSKKPCYIWDEKLIEECSRLPAVIKRASLVHNLIAAYKLLNHMQIVRSTPASYKELKEFHSELYLDHLKTITEIDDDYTSSSQDEEYGIGYDCPPVSNMFELVSTVAGGSITAAKTLVLGMTDVVINWCGGWHHAQRFSAAGFCYVNDIVLAIETLRRKFPKVLYIDLDVHHGDGVQDAYNLSRAVFTLSIHKYEPGFYPGTGGVEDIGSLTGTGYSCNVPLHASYSDETLEYVFGNVFPPLYSSFAPDAVVVQCGADALARDPHGGGALTAAAYRRTVRAVLDKRKPTLLLGGGGYNFPNAARLWATITAEVVGVDIDENIPEHTDWLSYGPDYMLAMEPTLARDTNKMSYLHDLVRTLLDNIDKYVKYPQNGETSPDVQVKEPEPKKRKIESEDSCDSIHVAHNNIVTSSTFKAKLNALDNKENTSLLQKEDSTAQDVFTFMDE